MHSRVIAVGAWVLCVAWALGALTLGAAQDAGPYGNSTNASSGTPPPGSPWIPTPWWSVPPASHCAGSAPGDRSAIRPDLVVKVAAQDGITSEGGDLYIALSVENAGGIATQAHALVTGCVNGTSVAGGSITYGLGPGESRDLRLTWRAAPAGIHQVTVRLDAAHDIVELDESNNEATVDVEVLGVPGVPMITENRPGPSADEVSLEWRLPSGSSAATVFGVYRRSSDGWEIIDLIRGGTDEATGQPRLMRSGSYVDRGLPPGTHFDYRVTAANGAGEGGASQVVGIRSPQPPSEVVGFALAHVHGSTDIVATWQAPEDPGGLLLHYEVTVKDASVGVTTSEVAAPPFRIAQLSEGAEVEVRLRAVNSAGPGPEVGSAIRTYVAPKAAIAGTSTNVTEGMPVLLRDISREGDSEIVDRTWVIEGTLVKGPEVNWTFTSAGTHSIKLEVLDQHGLTSSASADIAVVPMRGSTDVALVGGTSTPLTPTAPSQAASGADTPAVLTPGIIAIVVSVALLRKQKT